MHKWLKLVMNYDDACDKTILTKQAILFSVYNDIPTYVLEDD